MENQEICRFERGYSELEGLQQAHRMIYCARRTPEGVVLELAVQQAGKTERCALLCRNLTEKRAGELLLYFCENGVDPFQCLDVLEELGQRYEEL